MGRIRLFANKTAACEIGASSDDDPMRLSVLVVLSLASLLPQYGSAAIDPKLLLVEQKLGGFEDKDYGPAVEKTLVEFEGRTGINLHPSILKSCGLKLSSESGIGLSTPKPLVRAVTSALMRRGFTQKAIYLCDTKQDTLRKAGFLPATSEADQSFEGFPVLAWADRVGTWVKDPSWIKETQYRYENQVVPKPSTPTQTWSNERTSILPKTLMDDVDFWINLPVLSDSTSLGVHGAIASASLGNILNAERFLGNPANAAKAAVEVYATPKLAKRNALTILSLERYQVLGGPSFDAGWCRSEKTMLCSANPVIIDFVGLQKINSGRAASGIETIHPEPPIFATANSSEIRLGTCRPSEITLVRLPAP
jgi:hypothetical protein